MGGMNVARLNMCHGTREWHRDVIRKIKSLNEEKEFCILVMIDTEGTQIQVLDHGAPSTLKSKEGSIWFFTGEKFESSHPFTVLANHEGFAEGIMIGDELVIDGGMATFKVIDKIEGDLHCRCIDPGLFLPRSKFSFWRDGKLVKRNYELPTLSSKDWEDIDFGISEGVDFIAMSFVNDAEPIKNLKNYISSNSSRSTKVFAKIESLESLHKLKEIIEASDGVMVARGDLGVELTLEQIPTVQEEITQICRKLNKPVIVASQLRQSMVEYPKPTCTEVADVSKAVRQYADALMLSAIGSHGQKALSALKIVSRRMELWSHHEYRQNTIHTHKLGDTLSDRVAEELCNHAVPIANKVGVDAIFAYSKHEKIASLLSRNRPFPPIFAFTGDGDVRMALNMQWGITPLLIELSDNMEVNMSNTVDVMKTMGLIKQGDVLVVVSDLPLKYKMSTAFQSIQVRIIV